MYIIHFIVTAIILSFFSLYFFYSQNQIPNTPSRRYRYLIWIVLFSALSDIASSLAINQLPGTPTFWPLFFTTIYYLFHSSIPVTVALYIAAVNSFFFSYKKLYRILFFLPWVLSVVIILSNPLHKLAFYIDSNGTYQHGPFLLVLYLLAALYFIFSAGNIVFPKTAAMKKQRHTFMVALLLPISAIPVQYAIPGLMVETFTASLSVLFILLTIQNVNELIDGQTGLYGFEAFIMFLRQYLNEKTKFSLLIVYSRDMANFQGLFDTDIYTQAVQKYAEWLTDAVGRKNLVFVIDDGLFGVLSGNNWDESWAGLLSMNILNRSKEIWDFGAVQIKMPVRIGVFRFPDNNYSGVPEIMDLIDQLTDAPGHLGDRHIVFSTDFIPGKLQRETSIGSTLKRNIEQESLELSYQPIYSTSSKRFTALETLIKVTLQNGEIVRQSEVLRIAKNMGLSQRLGELILAKACKWYIQNDIAAKGIDHLHIRLLEAQCAELDWHDNVLKIVRDQGMEFERLYLAITEPSIVNTIKNLKPSMQQLASLGIRFALDDYGSGYTDLSQLLDIPLSLIKIDKKIVWSGLSNWKGRKLLSGSISMFNILGKKLVAEGIETREQAEMLTSIGCEFLQGYYYAKPENRETIISMLT